MPLIVLSAYQPAVSPHAFLIYRWEGPEGVVGTDLELLSRNAGEKPIPGRGHGHRCWWYRLVSAPQVCPVDTLGYTSALPDAPPLSNV